MYYVSTRTAYRACCDYVSRSRIADHVRSESPSVPFTNITQFFECEDVSRLCYVCRRIVSVYE